MLIFLARMVPWSAGFQKNEIMKEGWPACIRIGSPERGLQAASTHGGKMALDIFHAHGCAQAEAS
jgi:hypothetical protein